MRTETKTRLNLTKLYFTANIPNIYAQLKKVVCFRKYETATIATIRCTTGYYAVCCEDSALLLKCGVYQISCRLDLRSFEFTC